MHRHLFMAIVLIFTGIFIASNLYTMLPLYPEIAEAFGVTIPTASLSSSLFIFPYASGLFFFGLLADKLPHKKLLLVGMALLSVVTILVGLVDTYWLFLVLRALQGFLAASFAPTTFAYTFEHFTGKTQAFVIAMINTGFLFAGVFGQILSDLIAGASSYHAVYFTFFGIYALCWTGMLITLVPSKPKSFERLFSLSPILSFFRSQPLQKLYGITFFLLFTVMLFYGSFELYIYEGAFNLPISLQTFRVIGVIGIIPAFFVGTMQSRLGARTTLTWYIGLMACGFLFPVIHLNVFSLLVASICMIASTAVTIPMVILQIGSFGAHARASAVSIYSFTLLTGASIGSALAPFIPFPVALILIVGLFALLAMLALSVPEIKEISQKKNYRASSSS